MCSYGLRRTYIHVHPAEAIPFLEPKPAPTKPDKAKDNKPKKRAGEANQDKAQPTILHHFIQPGEDDSRESQGEVFENEDGTLSGGGPSEMPS